MPAKDPSNITPHWRGLPTALGLGVAALAAALGELHAHFASLLATHVSQVAVDSVLRTPVLRRAIVAFTAAQILLHLTLGLAAWLSARLTAATWPATRGSLRLLVLGWFALLYLLVGIANAAWYPWSATGTGFRTLLHVLSGGGWLPGALATLVAAALAAQLGIVLWRSRWRRLWIRALVWGGLLCLVAAVRSNMPRSESGAAVVQQRPNLVFIGIDSLRTDIVGMNGEPGYTPHLTAFLKDGHVFTDVTTPLARTFPSWIALLTGRDPKSTGARENLLPRAAIHTGPTLADRLRGAGYRTVFATDEVRFSNIDTSYGFDQTITPRIGTSDFVLGSLNDIPLSNLFANTWVAKYLFPDTYGNRAAAVTYDPHTFIKRVAGELRAGGAPLFFASHLTLPHWPYYWAADEDAVFTRTTDQSFAYLAAVVAADQQFGQLLDVLERKGVLDNAIVVVFSDHGEGLGLPVDNIIYSPAAKAAVGHLLVWMSGHGTSVLSPPQYHIVLGVRGFGNSLISAAPAVHTGDALCIEDIAPTMSELLGLPAAGGPYDGLSFAARLRSGPVTPPIGTGRIRFTESAFTTAALGAGARRQEELIGDADRYFHVNRANGRLEADMSRWGEMLQARERVAIGRSLLLAATPGSAPGSHNYIAVPLAGGLPRRLLQPPGEHDDPELRELWRALYEHFPGELGRPAQN